MSRVIKRHPLSRKDTKSFIMELNKHLGPEIPNLLGKKPKIELVKTQDCEYYLVEGRAILMRTKNEGVFPTLHFQEFLSLLPRILVDRGAVPHICNGADIMAPGIVKIEGNFNEEDIVLIVDENYKKPVAIGKALENSEKIRRLKKGKVILNIHYVGDKNWNFIKNL